MVIENIKPLPELGRLFLWVNGMKTDRAYSVFTVKAIDEDKREITGIASTPNTDRMGDVVEPDGAEYKLPIPLLFQHDHSQPIGEVYQAKTTKNGIEIRARLAKIAEPGPLADRLNTAWQSLKIGLIKGLSIGFRPIEYAFMDDGGTHFMKWEWYELSAVTIAANSECTVTSIKSLDAEILAAIGEKDKAKEKTAPSVKGNPPGDTGKVKKPTVKLPKEGKTMNVSKQIEQFQNERAAKAAQMEELMTKSAEAGETLEAEDAEKFDTLQSEIESIDKHLVRLEAVQKQHKETAKAVDPAAKTQKEGAEQRQGVIRVKSPELPKGIPFARLAKCKALSRLDNIPAAQIAKQLYGDDTRIANILEKAAVAAGTTSHATWAGPLVGDESSVFADFVEYLRPQTILGKFGNGGVPSLRNVPFRTRLIGQTSGGQGYWVGEGAPKPVTKFDFSGTTLEPLKVANIAVVTMELLRDSSPAAEAIVRDQLAAALRERLDMDFIDPSKASSAGVSPASITNGVTPIASSGDDAEAVRCDIRAIFAAFIAANNAPTTGVWIMSATTALSLSLMVNALGQSEFPGITMNGGTFWGMPVIVSEYISGDSTGDIVVLVNASDIYLGDDGGINVDMSDQASIQMLDNPTNNPTGSTVATSLISLWQTNSVGFRAERTINWSKRRDSAVAVLDGVSWGACNT